MNSDVIFISIVEMIALSLLLRQMFKALGMFNYQTNEEIKEYQDWLEKEGRTVLIKTTIGVVTILSFWIWAVITLW